MSQRGLRFPILATGLALLLAMNAACESGRHTQAPTADQRAAASARYPRLAIPEKGGLPDLSGVEIQFGRTSCFGWCPDYSLILHGDGRGEYEGRGCVKFVGKTEFTLAGEVLLEILDRFEAMNFLEMTPDEFPLMIDSSYELFHLTIGGRTRDFTNDWIMPEMAQRARAKGRPISQDVLDLSEQLTALATLIDERVHVEQWIGTDDERRSHDY